MITCAVVDGDMYGSFDDMYGVFANETSFLGSCTVVLMTCTLVFGDMYGSFDNIVMYGSVADVYGRFW